MESHSIKADIKDRFKQIIQIMTVGCKREFCPNSYCASSPFFKTFENKEKFTVEALTLLKNKADICLTDDFAPLSLQLSSLEPIISKFAPTEDFDTRPIAKRVIEVFNSIEALSLSFRVSPELKYFNPNDQSPCLDLLGLKNFFEKNLPKLKIQKLELLCAVRDSLKCLAKSPELCQKIFKSYQYLRVFFIYLELPDVMEIEYLDFFSEIVQVMRNLSSWALNVLKNWFILMPIEPFINYITQIQQLISVYIANESLKFESQIQLNFHEGLYSMLQKPDYAPLTNVIDLLHLFYETNQNTNKVQNSLFQNSSISNDVSPGVQYKIWKRLPGEFTFCNYNWLLEVDFKSKILDEESKDEQDHELKKGIDVNQILNMGMFNIAEMMNFTLAIRRDHIIEDTLNVLNQKSNKNSSFKKKLKVKFVGEPGIDEGGVKKEFFQILIKQLFDPNYGMFVEKMNKTLLWFNESSFECRLNFELFGMLLGLAIYNSINLDLRFPPLVFKKLLNEKLVLQDLKTFDVELFLGLSQLLSFEGNVEEIYCRSFQIEYESAYGEKLKINLKENGDKIPVTNENRQEFVELYVDWLVNKSVENQFECFKTGFYKVVSGDAIKLLNADELNIMICGTPKIDIKELQRVAYYEGFQKDSQIIKDLWEVLEEFSDEQLKKFLFFCTGSDRIPITGLQDFIIMKHGEDTDRLPTAHTCFNHLLLPHYNSKSKLKDKLLIALNNAEGFGLM